MAVQVFYRPFRSRPSPFFGEFDRGDRRSSLNLASEVIFPTRERPIASLHHRRADRHLTDGLF
ncbi:hypothetical protein JJD41_15545 [Oxynema sp. CENA135]|uniref:hypothetical protein n=1 Tax=Oxynema sp. CENA135 TaxID=984206 RepID=UPI00190BC36C|nr:hypothetical protein [Oxynema sp. CENA135]MBK4731265.1 hypothetical protein [Oxynema sp. CENA135]